MVFFIEFLIYLIYFIFRLYSLVDKLYLFSSDGDKLRKHIKSKNLQNITCNLDGQTKSNFILKFFQNVTIKSPQKFRKLILIYISIFILKISISFKQINSNFIYVSILDKNIILNSIFKYNILKYLYLFLFSFFLIDILIKIFKKINVDKETKKHLESLDNKQIINSNFKINIGYTKKGNNKNKVFINEPGLYQNILITGSIGSGKTSGAVLNIFRGLIENNVPGLIIDVKGDFKKDVYKVIENQNFVQDVQKMEILEISKYSKFRYNPLDKPDISEVELAHRVRKVLTLMSSTNISDSFWLDKAESVISDIFVIIRFCKKTVSFSALHKLVVSKKMLEESLEFVKNRILNNEFEEEELFKVENSLLNIKNEYFNLDDRTMGIIKAEITRVTSIFLSDKEIHDKFCSKSDLIQFSKNKIVILSLDIGENEKLAKILATYIKLDFQKEVLSKKSNKDPIFFLCDEFQELVNEEDARFFSISREFKCINIISVQSYSSIVNVLKKESTARVLIQNLVNKIWLRNDDSYTISEIIKQAGKEEKKILTKSLSESSQNSKYSQILGRFKSYKSGISESFSESLKNEYRFDEKIFSQKLKTFEAICLISDGISVEIKENVILREETDKW